MDAKELKQFLGSLKETDIEELCLESGETKIFFKRGDVQHAVSLPVRTEAAVLQPEEKKYIPIRSPMVGTFRHSESSNRPPFVIVGNHVVPGQKIGAIEAMKIMKDVDSTVKGKIVKILANDGQPVEYGQELVLIDTTDTAENA
jgi:acetyl-CoA carboxylase biotin carboxyl carrier protein